MKRIHCFLLLTSLVTVRPAGAAPDRILTMDGLGKVRIGMTLGQAQSALGAKLDPPSGDASGDVQSCSTTKRADGRDAKIWYMLEHGRIARIEVGLVPAGAASSPVTTATGIGVGSTEAAIEKAYGRKVVVQKHPYLDEDMGHYFVVQSLDGKKEIIFETAGGKVTSFRAGERKAVRRPEGCA